MRVRGNDAIFRDRVRRDRCRAFEVRDFVVRQAVGTFAREVVVADVPRPLAIRAVKRCTVRVVHAAECCIQSRLRIAIRDAGYIAVAVLRFVELRTIDRRRVANLDRQVGWRDARRVCEDLRRLAAFELVVAIRQRRLDVILTVADVLRLNRIPCLIVDIRRRRSRVADLFIAVDTLDLDFDRSRRITIDRREMRVRSNDVVFRDRVWRDRCRAFEVRDFVVRQAVGTFAREVVVADVPRPLAIRAVKRCIIRVVHATECRVQSLLRIAIRDAGCIVVAILLLVELRTIDRRRIVNLDRQAGWRDFRLAIHKRDIVIVQRIERGFRSIRKHQLIGVAHSRGPFIVCTVKCCFIIVLDFTKLCCQRTFRIAIDQGFARFSTIVIAILLFIKLRTIDRLGIANIDNQIRFFNCSFASQDFRIIVFQVIIKEVSTLRRFKTNRILITSICCPNTIFAISSSGIHVLSRKQAQFTTEACVQGFGRIAIDNAVRI